MSAPVPVVPPILYCGIPSRTQDVENRLLQSESVDAALTRLMTATGTLQTVNYEDHLGNRPFYVVQVECIWPNDKPKAILDPRKGSGSLRDDGYDVAIKTKENGRYWYVILHPYKVVYRIVFCPPSSASVVIASRSPLAASHRRRPQNDPRQPQEEVDSLLLKLNRPKNPLDEFSVSKVAVSHHRDKTWAKDEIVAILKRVWAEDRSAHSQCWRCVLVEGESSSDICLRVLFLSFGREPPASTSGLRTVHYPSDVSQDERQTTHEVCLRPSHLGLASAIDPSAFQRTAESLSSLLEQMGFGNGVK